MFYAWRYVPAATCASYKLIGVSLPRPMATSFVASLLSGIHTWLHGRSDVSEEAMAAADRQEEEDLDGDNDDADADSVVLTQSSSPPELPDEDRADPHEPSEFSAMGPCISRPRGFSEHQWVLASARDTELWEEAQSIQQVNDVGRAATSAAVLALSTTIARSKRAAELRADISESISGALFAADCNADSAAPHASGTARSHPSPTKSHGKSVLRPAPPPSSSGACSEPPVPTTSTADRVNRSIPDAPLPAQQNGAPSSLGAPSAPTAAPVLRAAKTAPVVPTAADTVQLNFLSMFPESSSYKLSLRALHNGTGKSYLNWRSTSSDTNIVVHCDLIEDCGRGPCAFSTRMRALATLPHLLHSLNPVCSQASSLSTSSQNSKTTSVHASFWLWGRK